MYIGDLGLKLVSFGYTDIPAERMQDPERVLQTWFRYFQQSHILDKASVYRFRSGPAIGKGLVATSHNGKDDSLVSYARVILSGNRVYELYANGYRTHFDSSLVNRFLNSLVLDQ